MWPRTITNRNHFIYLVIRYSGFWTLGYRIPSIGNRAAVFRPHFSERVTDGGRLSPHFYTNVLFCLFLSLFVCALGHPYNLNLTLPESR